MKKIIFFLSISCIFFFVVFIYGEDDSTFIRSYSLIPRHCSGQVHSFKTSGTFSHEPAEWSGRTVEAYKQKPLVLHARRSLGEDWSLSKDTSGNSESNATNHVEISKKESIFSLERLKEIFSLEKSKFFILVLAFLLGILASFTPCVYPMIPITIGILQAQAAPSLFRNFLLSLFYVMGIASVYALLGYVAATTTLMFGQWLANPWLIALIVLLFVYLAFSMFGFYEIYMPSFLTKRKGVKVKGSLLYSFLFGAISGIVASPCLTPALAILLSFIAKVGSPILGFLTLWFFAFGMGLLLIFVGTFSTTLAVLPRAGAWMVEIKKFFGFVLLVICVYFLQPFFQFSTILKMYAVLSAFAAIYYFSVAQKSKIKIVFGILLAIFCLILLSWSLSKRKKFLAQNFEQQKFSLSICDKKIKQVKVYRKDYGQIFCFGKRKPSCLC